MHVKGNAYRTIVRVLEGVNRRVGLGFIAPSGSIITAAHVVNAALGRAKNDFSKPESALVLVEFRLEDGMRSTTRRCTIGAWGPLELWQPNRDVVELRSEEDFPEGCEPVAFGNLHVNDSLHVCSPRLTWVEAKCMGNIADSLVQMDQLHADADRVGDGWSGGPVWQPEQDQVVGMVVMRPPGSSEQRGFVAINAHTIADLMGVGTPETSVAPAMPVVPLGTSQVSDLLGLVQRIDVLERLVTDMAQKLSRVERLAVLPNFQIPPAEAVRSLADLYDNELRGVRVLLVADIDIARHQDGSKIHFKIARLAESVKALVERQACVLILAAQGRTSVQLLEPVNNQDFAWHADALRSLLSPSTSLVHFTDVDAFEAASKEGFTPGTVALLPNLRELSPEDELFADMFAHRGRSRHMESVQLACTRSALAQTLRPHFEIFVLDDFRSTVNALPSNVGLAFGKTRVVGRGLETDLRALELLVSRCIEIGRKGVEKRVCITGSSRPEDVEVVSTFLESRLFDVVLLGPIPSLLVYKGMGYPIPSGIELDIQSLLKTSGVSMNLLMDGVVSSLINEYADRVRLPTDYLVADKMGTTTSRCVQAADLAGLHATDRIMSIGPDTLRAYLEEVDNAALVFHFGMMGAGNEPYLSQTKSLIRGHLESNAEVFMAGDHIIELAHDLGLSERIRACATGAQTTSAYITGSALPGLAPFIRESGLSHG